MALFQVTRLVAENRICILLNPDFSINNWASLEKFYLEQIKEGQLLWDLDLGHMRFMCSMMLGMIVGFNTVLANRGGKLRLLAPNSSKAGDLIVLSKLDTIIELIRYDTRAGAGTPVYTTG